MEHRSAIEGGAGASSRSGEQDHRPALLLAVRLVVSWREKIFLKIEAALSLVGCLQLRFGWR